VGENNSDISFTVAEVMGDGSSASSGNYEQPKYERHYNQSLQRQPYIPPRRTKDFWPKHFPSDGKR
jgi:hypothetical protein